MVIEYAASSILVLRPARWQIRRCSGGWCGCCGWQIRWWHLEHLRCWPLPCANAVGGMVIEYAASSIPVLCPARWQIRRRSGGWCGCCGWPIRWWHLEHCARSRAALECLHLLLSRHLTSGSVARLESYVEIRHPRVEAHCAHSTFLRHSLHHVLSWAVGSAALSPC